MSSIAQYPNIVLATSHMKFAMDTGFAADQLVYQAGRIVVGEMARGVYGIILCTTSEVVEPDIGGYRRVLAAPQINHTILFSCDEGASTVTLKAIWWAGGSPCNFVFAFDTTRNFLAMVRILVAAKVHGLDREVLYEERMENLYREHCLLTSAEADCVLEAGLGGEGSDGSPTVISDSKGPVDIGVATETTGVDAVGDAVSDELEEGLAADAPSPVEDSTAENEVATPGDLAVDIPGGFFEA